MENIIKLETIQDYNNLLGTKTLHPLVSVTAVSYTHLRAHETRH